MGHDILEAVKRGLARDPKTLDAHGARQQAPDGTARLELFEGAAAALPRSETAVRRQGDRDRRRSEQIAPERRGGTSRR